MHGIAPPSSWQVTEVGVFVTVQVIVGVGGAIVPDGALVTVITGTPAAAAFTVHAAVVFWSVPATFEAVTVRVCWPRDRPIRLYGLVQTTAAAVSSWQVIRVGVFEAEK